MTAPNHYEILEVARHATTAQIRAAFRRLARKWHPDRHADEVVKREATRQMQQINLAHDTLKDDLKREKYDLRLANPPLFQAPVAPTSPQKAPRRATPRQSPWQRAATRPQPEARSRAAPPVENFPNSAQETASNQRHKRAIHAVRTHFDGLIRRYPDQKAKLLATLGWQLTKIDAAVRLGREKGQSEAAALSKWVQSAKRAGDNRIETPPFAPRDPNRPQPKAAPQTQVENQVVAAVTAYFAELTRQNPLDKQPLRAALDWQLKRKTAEVAHLQRAGLSEARALERWAQEARAAAEKQLKKR